MNKEVIITAGVSAVVTGVIGYVIGRKRAVAVSKNSITIDDGDDSILVKFISDCNTVKKDAKRYIPFIGEEFGSWAGETLIEDCDGNFSKVVGGIMFIDNVES